MFTNILCHKNTSTSRQLHFPTIRTDSLHPAQWFLLFKKKKFFVLECCHGDFRAMLFIHETVHGLSVDNQNFVLIIFCLVLVTKNVFGWTQANRFATYTVHWAPERINLQMTHTCLYCFSVHDWCEETQNSICEYKHGIQDNTDRSVGFSGISNPLGLMNNNHTKCAWMFFAGRCFCWIFWTFVWKIWRNFDQNGDAWCCVIKPALQQLTSFGSTFLQECSDVRTFPRWNLEFVLELVGIHAYLNPRTLDFWLEPLVRQTGRNHKKVRMKQWVPTRRVQDQDVPRISRTLTFQDFSSRDLLQANLREQQLQIAVVVGCIGTLDGVLVLVSFSCVDWT